MDPRSIDEIDFRALTDRTFHPSPAAWEDEVLYFLLVDRFSDAREHGYRDAAGDPVRGETPPLQPGDHGNAVGTEADAAAWRAAGAGWVGGTLAGLRTKLGYLRRLGVTAVWVSPVLRQVPGAGTYHGYGTHDFLAVDPHFGTGDDLRDLVADAHELGIRVVLDIVLNHAGDVFAYEPDVIPPWTGRPYPIRGFRGTGPTGAVWPAELQRPGTFTGKGRIVDWDHYPEYVEGDFDELKDIHLGDGDPDDYQPSPALITLTRAYQYWIASADLDGFRVDTVKHMDLGAARYFASAIHEFAQSIGKERFALIAEITGDRAFAVRTLQSVGMDAALGIADVQDQLEWTVKGARDPAGYFALFRNSLQVGVESNAWFRDRVVTGFDDHDQVRKGAAKARFAADDAGRRLTLAALALNATTLGIPCVYYGSEQTFDGSGGNDRYIREAMFGGAFGAFRSRGRHAFDETHPVYVELAKILALRRRIPALRRGRQYLREIADGSDGSDGGGGSGDGSFGLPRLPGPSPAAPGTLRSVVPWSRIFADQEVLLAINTDVTSARTAWVTVDAGLHAEGATLTCRYSTDPGAVGQAVTVEARNGRAVLLTVPAAGFVMYTATG